MLYAPNSTLGAAMMRQYAIALACPPGPATLYPTFHHYFKGDRGLAACNAYDTCVITPACHAAVWEQQVGMT